VSAAARLGVQQLYVFVTSAVRDAANRDQILDHVEAEAGVRPQYLAGVDECRLTYLAVHQWYGWSAGSWSSTSAAAPWRSRSAGTPNPICR
jgi:exopolyphosphatase/guanosine-5'-triphosphate,3'-diphosphate pyrophosphatase